MESPVHRAFRSPREGIGTQIAQDGFDRVIDHFLQSTMALHAIEEADFVILGFADARMNSDIYIQPREELLWIYACDEQSSETHMTVFVKNVQAFELLRFAVCTA